MSHTDDDLYPMVNQVSLNQSARKKNKLTDPCEGHLLNIEVTWVCSGSLRSSSTVSKSSDGKPRLKLRSVRKLTARVERPANGFSA